MLTPYCSCLRLTAFIVTLLLTSACTHDAPTHHMTSEPADIHKLFVFAQLGTEENVALASAFATAAAREFQACNIDVKIDNVPVKDRSLSLDTDPSVAVNADLKSFKPDYFLHVGQQNPIGLLGTYTSINFMLVRLLDGKPLWNGIINTQAEQNAAMGTMIAQSIMSKAAVDHVIKNCPLSSGNPK